ncbi:hypothetical protein PFISCL1PPCAC_13055, partial [Pristionchus fissidentatus]
MGATVPYSVKSIDNLSLVYRSPSVVVDYRTRRPVSLRLVIIISILILLLLECLSLLSLHLLLIHSSSARPSRLFHPLLRRQRRQEVRETHALTRLPVPVCFEQEMGRGIGRVILQHELPNLIEDRSDPLLKSICVQSTRVCDVISEHVTEPLVLLRRLVAARLLLDAQLVRAPDREHAVHDGAPLGRDGRGRKRLHL